MGSSTTIIINRAVTVTSCHGYQAYAICIARWRLSGAEIRQFLHLNYSILCKGEVFLTVPFYKQLFSPFWRWRPAMQMISLFQHYPSVQTDKWLVSESRTDTTNFWGWHEKVGTCKNIDITTVKTGPRNEWTSQIRNRMELPNSYHRQWWTQYSNISTALASKYC